jgi:hypothetical protein
MPNFRWKGKSADGYEVTGEAKGPSKESVVEQLRAQRILVSSIAAVGGDEPDLREAHPTVPVEGSGPLADRLTRARAGGRGSPLKGMLIVGAFLAASLGVGLMAPIIVCRCERTGAGPIDATLSERDLGLFTIREQKLEGLTSVDVETRFFSERVGTSNRQKAEARIVLHNQEGATIRPSAWHQDGGIGTSTSEMQTTIDRFLADSRQDHLSMWQGQWVPLLLAAICALIAFLMLIATVLSSFQAPTEWLYASVGRLAAAQDAKRRREGR